MKQRILIALMAAGLVLGSMQGAGAREYRPHHRHYTRHHIHKRMHNMRARIHNKFSRHKEPVYR